MATFALVHGAWHGAWCWERVHAPLRDRGHDAVAVELPCDDPDAGLTIYARVIAEATAERDEPIVVVGHSLGGLCIPLVAAYRPVEAIVYLAAFIPVPGQSMADQFRASPEPILLMEGGRETDEAGRSRWVDAETTARVLYAGVPRADADAAFAQLRPQASLPQREPFPAELSATTRAVSIVCSEDRVVNPAWSRRVTRERLGTQPVELPGGHFPMFTAPEALADVLSDSTSPSAQASISGHGP
jgi:pimeloyl-ACP methyl ester carboxylesterase